MIIITGFNDNQHFFYIMRKSLFSILVLILLSCQLTYSSTRSYALMFDISRTQYQRNKEWTRVKIGVQGGQGKIQTLFDQYPRGWRYVDDSIYIPKESLKINRKYPLKIRLLDNQGNQARASIVYNIKNGRVVVSEQIFPYDRNFDDNFFNSDGYIGRPSMVQSGSFYQTTSNIDMSKNKLYTPNNQLQNQKSAINSLDSISNSKGSGLNSFYKNYRGNNKEGVFNLTNFLNLAKVNSNSQSQNNEYNPDAPSQETDYNQASIPSIPLISNIFSIGQVPKITTNRFTNPAEKVDLSGFSNFIDDYKNNMVKNIFENPTSVKTFNVDFNPNSLVINRPRDQSFSSLPSSVKMDELILTADLISFSKLIQQVSRITSLSCEQKASYLSVFLGRMQSAISMKKFTFDQLLVLKQTAQTSYNFIKEQITKNEKEASTLGIGNLKAKLNQNVDKLKILYNQYNKVDTNNEPIQLKIKQLKKNIEIQKSKSQLDRDELIRQKLAYNEADVMVQRYQKLLNDAKSTKNTIVTSISKLQSDISQTDIQIEESQKNISVLEEQVTNTNSNLDSLKIQYTNLQATVSRYRSDISKFSKKQTQLNNEIANLEERLRIERKKIVTDQQTKLQEMISGLQKTLPTISEFVDNNYYKCFKANNLEVTKQDNTIVYVVGANDFQNYIQNAYQLQPDWSNIKLPTSIKLRAISLLDSAWQSSYGVPYDTISYSSTKDYSFNSDFNCLNPSSLISGSGIINSIGNKFIQINGPDGTTNRLNLGACTRLQTTSFLPTVGQRIYWRGMPSSGQGQYNGYRVSCI